MDDDTVRAQVRSVMELVLKVSPTTSELARADTPEWDSLKHIELLFTLEDAFEMRFEQSEMENLDSLTAITNALRVKVG